MTPLASLDIHSSLAPPPLDPVNEFCTFRINILVTEHSQLISKWNDWSQVLTSVTGTAELCWRQMKVSTTATATATLNVFILGGFDWIHFFTPLTLLVTLVSSFDFLSCLMVEFVKMCWYLYSLRSLLPHHWQHLQYRSCFQAQACISLWGMLGRRIGNSSAMVFGNSWCLVCLSVPHQSLTLI